MLAGALLAGHALASLPNLSAQILKDIHANRGSSFTPLLSQWQKRYGTQAVSSLVSVARDSRNEDSDRYVALMGATKLGGSQIAPAITPLLHDRSWMLRDGALRALAALNNESASNAVLPLLKDPALVVRLQAIVSVERLHPPGSADALIATLVNKENYHNGKAQWVPQRALEALTHLAKSKALSKEEMTTAGRKIDIISNDPAALAARDKSFRESMQKAAEILQASKKDGTTGKPAAPSF